MKSLMTLFAICFALCPAVCLAEDDLSGTWSGGYGRPEAEGPTWSFCWLSLESTSDGYAGRGNFGRSRASFDFEITHCAEGSDLSDMVLTGRVAFNGRTLRVRLSPTDNGEVLHGVVLDSGEEVRWRRVDPDSEAALEGLTGLYNSPHGSTMIAPLRPGVLRSWNLDEGIRSLWFACGEGLYKRSDRYAIPGPMVEELQIERDDAGKITALRRRTSDGEVLFTRRNDLRHEEFQFEVAPNLELSGTLHLPGGPGPHPVVVYVHGSGRSSRNEGMFWAHEFASRGFAFLCYDKRGVGKSQGNYELPNGSHDNPPHMARRAGDVRKAVETLVARSDIDARQVGLFGGSQAGWVIPQALAMEESHSRSRFPAVWWSSATNPSSAG